MSTKPHHSHPSLIRRCSICDYESKTRGRLEKHLRDSHNIGGGGPPSGDDSMEGLQDISSDELDVDLSLVGQPDFDLDESSVSAGLAAARQSVQRCRQCSFRAVSKTDLWRHKKTVHMNKDKILQCPKCEFVTEYKHHLEYHLRNHFNSKPFRCQKCEYRCVNKSMLNSHMKSHNNVYQHRCFDCSYATKYQHRFGFFSSDRIFRQVLSFWWRTMPRIFLALFISDPLYLHASHEHCGPQA